MRRISMAILALLLACGGSGGDGGNGPGNAKVQGTWVVTFTSSVGAGCSVGQVSLTLLADNSSPFEGSHGSYVVDCTGQPQISEPSDHIAAYQVSGSNVSVQFTNAPDRFFVGTVSGATMTGNFTWKSTTVGQTYNISGTFTAAKQ
ncbi:MAG: hypothetical protein ABI836_02335 [Gemmatimonadota bacterium]